MTFEQLRVPGLSDDEGRTLNRLLEAIEDKAPRNLLRASYYDGKRAVRQVGTIIPPQYYRLGMVLGWSGKAVDALARRCNLDGFVWPDGDLSSLGYAEVRDANYLRTEVSSAVTSAKIHGVSFLVTTKGSDDEPPALIHARDALTSTGTWNVRRRGLDDFVSVTSRNDDGKVTGFVLYLDGLTIDATKDSSGWSLERSEHPWGVPVEPLVYKPRVGRPFGQSRISRPIMSLHDQALREIIRAEGHMDVYSFPELWMLGADMSVFKNEDGSMKADWQIMLGRIKGLPDADGADVPRAEVKQIPASSPEPHLAWLNALAKMFSREASLPDTAVAITDVSNPTSAESYDSAQYELIAEAEGATEDYSPPLRRTVSRALAIANGLDAVPAEWSSIETKWRNPRYLAKSAQADAGMKQLTVAPWLADTEVGLELLGLDEQQIRRAMADKRRAQGRGVLDALAVESGVTDADVG